jgi:hypothetical protein
MALSRINSQSIADGTVIASDIADGSITTAKIADGNVTSAKIDTVANTKIAGNIVSSQITSVSNTQITGVITTSQLANNLTVNASSIISSANIDFKVGASQNTAAKIDSNENLQFNSGYGSVATAYGCRAWVNFNGTGTVAIRASGNVSSITDNGTGDYTVNFTTAMSDANYCISAISSTTTGTGASITTVREENFGPNPTTALFRLSVRNPSFSDIDLPYVFAAVFR